MGASRNEGRRARSGALHEGYVVALQEYPAHRDLALGRHLARVVQNEVHVLVEALKYESNTAEGRADGKKRGGKS